MRFRKEKGDILREAHSSGNLQDRQKRGASKLFSRKGVVV